MRSNFMFLLYVAIIVFVPLLTIWCLNTLFTLGIAYSFTTWFACFWLQLVTFGGVTSAIQNLTEVVRDAKL